MTGGSIGRIRVAIGAALVLCAVASMPGQAAASPVPGALGTSLGDRYVEDAVFDGTFAFWIQSRRVRTRGGHATDTRLVRQLLTGGPVVVLFSAKASDGEELVDVQAAAGVVAIQVERERLDRRETVETRIVRMNAFGGEQRVVAAGARSADFNPRRKRGAKPRPGDCGTEVSLQDVSPTGELAIGSLVSTRTGADCGGTENSNAWKYSAVGADGSSRAIVSVKEPVRLKVGRFGASCDCDAGARRVELNGDWAMVAAMSGFTPTGHRLVNLTTGMISDSYSLGARAGLSFVSFDSSGRAAAFHAELVTRKRSNGRRTRGYRFRSLSHPVAGSPETAVRIEADAFSLYCGDRLIGLRHGVRSAKLFEYDPLTGASVREVAAVTGSADWEFEGCDAGTGFFSREVRGRLRVLAVRLD